MRIKGNHSRYEFVFKRVLDLNQIPYLPILETRKVLGVKNFDFLLPKINRNRAGICDCKGKQFPYELTGKYNFWENFVFDNDLQGLMFWEEIFQSSLGGNIESFFVFLYQIKDPVDQRFFETVVAYKKILFGIVAIDLHTYRSNMKRRSMTPLTVSVSRDEFAKMVISFEDFIGQKLKIKTIQ